MIEADKRSAIESALLDAERVYDVRVLYAVESGSRAWGFASTDSDYDVRFIFVHRRDWYLSIESGRDVIEEMLPGDIDLAGWDLRKALHLLRKSNPPLHEWLRSPIVYREDPTFVARLKAAADSYYSPKHCFLHYLSMAETNFRDYLQGEEVWTKKYLYVLRPITACLWIEKGLGPVPMEFESVAEKVIEDPALLSAIQSLLDRKRKGVELSKGPRVEVISGFIEAQIPRLVSVKQKPDPLPHIEPLNELFRSAIG